LLERRDSPRVFVFEQRRRRKDMTKVSSMLAALAVIGVAAPTLASAQDFSVRIGGDRDYYGSRDYYRDRDYRGPRAEFYGHDRGYHRGWDRRDGDRVIVRRQRHWED
jgi:hypothetical protein